MTSQERVKTAIARQQPDRVPIFDQPWPETLARWQSEGMPDGVPVGEFFDFDIVQLAADLSPQFPHEVLEETDDFIIERTSYGTVWKRLKSTPSVLQTLEHPIQTRDDWNRMRDRFLPHRGRVDWRETRRLYLDARARGKYVAYVGFAGNSQIEGLMGMDRSLCLMIEDPEWYRDMVEVLSNLFRDTVLMMCEEGIRLDAVWYPNDMGYRNGTTFSPGTYIELMGKTDAARNAVFHELSMQTILHSDGRIHSLIPAIIDAGFDCLQPLEVKAGMELKELKRDFGGRIALFGGIDARLMSEPNPDAIATEIRAKFAAAMPGGGYLYHSDHSVPSNVSLAQFQHVLDCVRTYGAYYV